jgi:hypothetical protein
MPLLETIAGWIAPAATMIAAMMTAANLGARVTGWGFVVFVAGSISWSIVGMTTGQANLVATNGFLTLVNLIGVWRWLGRQSTYEDGGKSAKSASRHSSAPTLFTATGIGGMPALDNAGKTIGKGVEALIECKSGGISYVVVASSGLAGVGEELRAVPAASVCFSSDQLVVQSSEREFLALPPLGSGDWPADARHLAPADS